MGVAELVVGSLLAVIGLYLTHSLRRQQSLKIADQRLEAYKPLWQLTKIAGQSVRSRADEGGPLTREEGRKLRREMLDWYYVAGNGMFLTKMADDLYTEVDIRLGDYIGGEDDHERAARCMRDFSLLRQQMRLDLKTLCGRPSYRTKLDEGDKELLEKAGIWNPESWGIPWHQRLLTRGLHVSPAARKFILQRGDTVYVYRAGGWLYRLGLAGLKVTIEPPPELSFVFHEVDDVRVALESGLPDRESLTIVLWRLPRTLTGFDRSKVNIFWRA